MRLTLHLTAACVAVLFLSFDEVRSNQFEKGEKLYQENCALCHGADGRGGQGYNTPIWGNGSQPSKFGGVQGLFEYIQLLMPFDDPTRVSDEEKWAILHFMLVSHGSMKADQTLDPTTAPSVKID